MTLEQMLKELGRDWLVDLTTRKTHGWTLSLTAIGEGGSAFVYYGENLRAIVGSAWAGEPAGLVR